MESRQGHTYQNNKWIERKETNKQTLNVILKAAMRENFVRSGLPYIYD